MKFLNCLFLSLKSLEPSSLKTKLRKSLKGTTFVFFNLTLLSQIFHFLSFKENETYNSFSPLSKVIRILFSNFCNVKFGDICLKKK